MEYSLSHAAKVAKLSKSTVHRAIKSGKLSAKRLDDGAYIIDASELARVFPPEMGNPLPEPVMNHLTGRSETAAATTELPGTLETELAVLRAKVALLEDHLRQERDQHLRERETLNDQLHRERELSDDFRERLTRVEDRTFALLGASVHRPAVDSTPSPMEPEKAPLGFLGRLFGRS